jgi:hypothetical protein
VKYELGFCIPEDDILHSHRRDNVTSYTDALVSWDLTTFLSDVGILTKVMNSRVVFAARGQAICVRARGYEWLMLR